ncbi:MAG: hypothetical protein IJC27_01015 [Lentisphaeria bacterium]|nr:hypothetical protein [Lentisphaeria bacterium]
MKQRLFISLLLLVSGCTAAKKPVSAVKDTAIPMEHCETTEIIHPRVTLDNGLWKLSLIPSTMGGFDRFYSAKHPENLFWGISHSKTVTGGLIERNITIGHMLVERFWGVKGIDVSLMPMQVTASGKNFVELYASPYGASAVALRRRVTLPEGENAILVNGKVTNLANRELKIRPWINYVPREGRTIRLIPAKGNVGQTGVGSTSRMAEDGIYSLSKERNVFLPPVRNFIAVNYQPENCTVAILPENSDLADSAFYMYNGTIAGKRSGGTIEYIIKGTPLKKGESLEYSYRIAVYENMPRIRDIAGTVAVDAAVEGKKLTVKLAVFRSEESQKLRVQLKSPAGKVITLPERETIALSPEKTVEIVYELPENTDDKWVISGDIGGNKFELLKLFLDTSADLGDNFK